MQLYSEPFDWPVSCDWPASCIDHLRYKQNNYQNHTRTEQQNIRTLDACGSTPADMYFRDLSTSRSKNDHENVFCSPY